MRDQQMQGSRSYSNLMRQDDGRVVAVVVEKRGWL